MNKFLTPSEVRQLCRTEDITTPTPGLAAGYNQANLVILPHAVAFDFLLFCHRNPKPCPVLDVTEVGNPEPRLVAPNADLRTDLPRYRIFRHGELIQEVTHIKDLWQDDFVGFLIGCSFSFESAMLAANIPVRHIEENKNVPMYKTNISCQPAGIFSGSLVVSMRPLPASDAIRAIQITSRFPKAHGAPVHWGNPEEIGITNINQPDFGDAITINPGEIPLFWACGVTPQVALLQAKPEIAITHSPGHMFITDIKDEDLTN
ncbi:putative hydro-lyase [Calothrix sp. UHCC 0171]|uniref:putative hydro-lyase n=1 Tax=Calothrix sp. UHCC 0171 TaxID=3110245 RepID=UPI002B214EAD|nr:putative hydro-lyase [Calothrix sp. UHCC 0171]MEA5570094.1 putative hydro-lyase [Calothrix sp. UHCC 0171]